MILVSGSIAHDNIMTYDGIFADHILAEQLPALSMGFGISSLEKYHGGTGHNIAYTLGLLGAKEQTIMIGSVGKDFVAPHPEHIDYHHIITIDSLNTATGFIFSDTANNQITPFYPGAMSLAHSQKISEILGENKQKSCSHAIISPNDTIAMIEHLEDCYSLGITTIFDPGQAIHFMSNEDLIKAGKIADMLIMNEYERELRKQKTGLDENNPDCSAHTIIITLGAEGVKFLSKNDKQTFLPDKGGESLTVEGLYNYQKTTGNRQQLEAIMCPSVLDPTGAGDALRGGLLYGLLNKKSLEESLSIGQKMARHCIQVKGAQNYSIS